MNVKSLSVSSLVSTLLLIFLTVPLIPVSSGQPNSELDKLRFKVVLSPDAQLIAMQNGELDVLTGMKRTGDIEKLDGDGFTITSAPGFHMGHIGFNIRSDQSYRRDRRASELPYVAAVLSDVNFRHACFHAYDQELICASLYGYIVTPIQSLVPPAQGGWMNPNVPKHPYNPGDPFANSVYNPATGENEDSCSILRYGGYTFVDADSSGTVTRSDYWTKSGFGGAPLPTLHLFTPTYEVAPTSAEHGHRWIASLNDIGLNNMIHRPHEFSPYITKVFQNAEFDMYMLFWSLERFPHHLYDMCYSSPWPWWPPFNAPGISDPELDKKLEILEYDLDHEKKMVACHEIQRMLYDENYPKCAFAYMQLYSRTYFNAFKPGLKGIINSPGYGSDNSWTYLNMYWELGHPNERVEEGESMVIWCLDYMPDKLNPCSTLPIYESCVMGRLYDPFLATNPYTHEDLPWLAESWEMLEDLGTMNITFNLRTDLYWHDGEPYTAEDAKFNWLFLRDNAVPRYSGVSKHIVDVEIIDTYTVRVILNVASLWLLYDLSETAALLPPQVWTSWNGKPLDEILDRDLSEEVGPQPDPEESWYCPTNLYGTGPFIFDHYDPILKYFDLLRNRNYFKTSDEISAQIVDMFHEAGDVNSNGEMEGEDLNMVTLAFGSKVGDLKYDPEADVNYDGFVDIRDLSMVCYSWGRKREYP